ncbi:MAG: hypothetical protein KR126chlam4_01405 [Candidatus Anoxychlamydiales bacterium]|nr:hypothetical protein [Candidatus Anoxychlamydiales bacterium]NGX41563.1 hypothetical protein [Candidatus Anoxychlamydiales bacterium]
MKIDINELEKITKKLFSHLKKEGISNFIIDKDFYWNIAEKERYNPYQNPSNFNLGQLFDDWDNLLKINKNKSEPISYAFVWLSSILKWMGENIVA